MRNVFLSPIAVLCSLTVFAGEKPFAIEIVDEQTGRGVPLVELKTTSGLRFYADSAGIVAVREPELFGRKVYFHVRSHGYEYPRDGFGNRGLALQVESGGSAVVKIKRQNIAERLYRVTGSGIYADSLLVGRKPPLAQPLVAAEVVGSDSVVTAVYRGKLYWFWGDTNRFGYPLGLFDASGAVSKLPSDGGLAPSVGVNLDYFTGDEGFAKKMAPMPGDGPTWLFGMFTLPDETGRERLFTGYEKVRGLSVYQRGLARFDDERAEFVSLKTYDKAIPLYWHGHPFLYRDGDTEYFYFGDPYPVMRVRATIDAIDDPSRFEGFTCLTPGARKGGDVERDANGRPVWSWKRDTAAISHDLQRDLMKAGKLTREEAWLQFANVDDGKPVIAHRGSVTWNERLKKFVLIATEIGGASMLGEVWFATADKPEGPWQKAKKIVTHEKYSFYNPKQHPYFAEDGGRTLYFEGTYTHTFSGNDDQTPRYDYNQVMYRLDVDDPRLEAVR